MRRIFLSLALVLVFGLGRLSSAVGAGSSPPSHPNQLTRLAGLVQRYFLRPVPLSQLEEGAQRGLVASLGDPYSVYFSPTEMVSFRHQAAGQLVGIGVRLERRGSDYYLHPIPNSPAARAGLREGDLLLGLGGRSVRGLSPQELLKLLQGRPGERLALEVERGGRRERFSVRREEFHLPVVQGGWLEPGVSYLRLYQFVPGASRAVAAQLAAFRQKPWRAMVLDLRGNPGGLLDQALAIGRQLLPRGPMTTVQSREGRTVYSLPGPGLGRPILVLVDRGTASAAELLAGAIQDDRAGLLLGERTYGKGLVQRIFPLPGGAGVKLTIARYYTPAGHFINGRGLEPDLPVPSGTALTVAKEMLRR